MDSKYIIIYNYENTLHNKEMEHATILLIQNSAIRRLKYGLCIIRRWISKSLASQMKKKSTHFCRLCFHLNFIECPTILGGECTYTHTNIHTRVQVHPQCAYRLFALCTYGYNWRRAQQSPHEPLRTQHTSNVRSQRGGGGGGRVVRAHAFIYGRSPGVTGARCSNTAKSCQFTTTVVYRAARDLHSQLSQFNGKYAPPLTPLPCFLSLSLSLSLSLLLIPFQVTLHTTESRFASV